LYQARQRFREANQGRDTLPNQGYQAQQTAEHLKPAFLRTDAPNWHAQNANGGRLSRVNAEKGHFFDRAALANGCADLGGGGGCSTQFFTGYKMRASPHLNSLPKKSLQSKKFSCFRRTPNIGVLHSFDALSVKSQNRSK
jgi:hypothetical protein